MQGKKKIPGFFFALILFLLSCSVAEIQGKKQSHALRHLNMEKMKGRNLGINLSILSGNYAVNSRNFHSQDGLKEKDKIVKLPGQPKVKFAQYGGYVTVDKSAGRAMFYYFVEAHHSKNSAPLLLWLNGGPGCSSLGYGAMEELGPFRVYSDGKTLYRNPYAWNQAANVLFLESPAGVGFSYSNRTSDYNNFGDRKTAEDNYVFLVNWLERFPEYKDRDFYISGESYAGHYVPQLAHTILAYNRNANKTIINLKGIIIGNAVINEETDTKGMFDYLHSHALISDDLAFRIRKNCKFLPYSTVNSESNACNEATDAAVESIYFLDISNIYAPLCTDENVTTRPKRLTGSFDPCNDYYVMAYLNSRDVQEALHANVTRLNFKWQHCSDVIDSWKDSPPTMIPLLRDFMAAGLRVWIYSGDVDGIVSVTSTRSSINVMKLPVKTPWHHWLLDGEVGGYTEVYKGDLTFVTIRGAGHEVPSYQPRRALAMIEHFLAGRPLPNVSHHS